MRRIFFGILIGVFLGSLGIVVAQTPTIFSSIRVLNQSDLRGSVVNGTGSVLVADDFIVDVSAGADELTVGTDLTTITNLTVTGTCTGCSGGVSYPLLAPDGTTMAPSYSFTNDTDAGLWLNGASNLILSIDGGASSALNLTTASAILGGDLVQLDTASGTSFTISANLAELVSGSLLIDSVFRSSELGSVTNATYGWDMDDNTGVYSPIADSLAITTGGTQRALFNASGATLSAIVSSGALTLDGAVTTDNTSADEVGYKGIPQNIQAGNYTLVLTDAATHIYHASGAGAGDTYTIPANSSVAYPIGTVVTFLNDDSSSISIAITTDTMTLAGTTTTGTRTLAENGVATAIKVTSTTWIINGTGITAVFEPLSPINDEFYDAEQVA